MKLSKERRVYAAVLSLAAAGWGVERMFFAGGPASASAGEVAVAVAPALPEMVAPVAAPAISLAERLEGLRAGVNPGEEDAFQVPDAWKPAKAVEATATDQIAKLVTGDGFRKAHRLTAVVAGPDPSRNAASVDGGALMRVGADLDGFTLREVTNRGAVFERDGMIVTLDMDLPGLTGGTADAASGNSGPGAAR